MKASHRFISALCCSVLVSSIQSAYSQGFYFNAGGSYSFSSSNISYANLCPGVNGYPTYNDLTPFSFAGANETYTITQWGNGGTYSDVYKSLNKGFGGGAGFFISAGYGFTKNISTEVGFSYLPGTTLQSTYTNLNTIDASSNDVTTDNQTVVDNLTSSPIYRIMPEVKFSIPISKFTAYMKAGLIVGLGEKVTISNVYTDIETDNGNSFPQQGGNGNMSLTASGGLSLGYIGSLGVEYTLSNLLSVYCEFNIINESWSPTKGDITAFNIEGSNPPYTLTNSQFTYSNNYTSSGAVTYTNPNSNVVEVNSQYPKQTFSFNSYGFAIGVKFSIPTKKSAAPTSPDSPAKAN